MKLMKLGIALTALVVFNYQSVSAQAASSTRLTTQQTHQLNQLVDNAPVEHGIVGHTVMVLQNGKLAYSRSIGKASLDSDENVTQDTIYPIYSVTKLYVSALLLRLIEQDKLDVNKPVSTYLDGLPKDWQDIKLTSLMAHSSGLPEFFDLSKTTSEDPKAIIESLREAPFAFPINTQIRYNQTNFLLLKLIIEKLYEKPLTAVIEHEIVKPYALKNTVYGGGNVTIPGRSTHYYIRENGELSDFGVWPFVTTMFAATGLNTTGTDIAKWFEALISGDFVATNTLLNTWQPITLETGKPAAYSHGWQVQKESTTTAVGHYGGNIINARHFYMNDDPSESVTVLHLTNGGFYPTFSSFDFSYAVARAVNPDIKMDTVDFKQRLHVLAHSNKLEQLVDEYTQFKQHPHTQQLNTEFLINDLGYQLLDSLPQTAVKLFELNTHSYPNSANAYDSYAEALYQLGELAKAKHYFQKAYELDSTYNHIPEMFMEIDKALAE